MGARDEVRWVVSPYLCRQSTFAASEEVVSGKVSPNRRGFSAPNPTFRLPNRSNEL